MALFGQLVSSDLFGTICIKWCDSLESFMMPGSVFLIHWQEGEAFRMAEMLATAGWVVAGIETEDGGRAYQLVKEIRPDVLVVDLSHKPGHGRRTAEAICSLKAFHTLPVLFVGGSEREIERARRAIPDGVFTDEVGVTAVLDELMGVFA